MSSGTRQLVVNPLERALSGDIMRAQSFIGAALSQMLQALCDTGQGSDDLQAGGQYIPNTIAGTPSSAQIYSGLLLQPTGGSVASVVSPGDLSIFDPDASPSADDCQDKLIHDPGTSTLTLTTNSSGSLRIDVLECSRVQPDNVSEVDSRDVFNTVTGTFAAAAVNKVTIAQLQYRIRLGTAGGGFPGTVQGWLPLAVISVPTGTTVWDTTTIYDVRPLLEDRIFSLTSATRDMPLVTRCYAQVDATTSTNSKLTGVIEAQLGSRRVGGIMRPSTPATAGGDAYYVDLDDAQNIAAGQTISSGAVYNYVYISTPFGLPRWAKYTLGPTGRVPRSPRGIVFCSSTAPNLAYGTPSAPLPLPPCLQNSGNSSTDATAVCVMSRIGSSGGSRLGSVVASGGVHTSIASSASNVGAAPGGGSNWGWTLVAGTDYPPHARALYVQVTIVAAGNLDGFMGVAVPGGAVTAYQSLTPIPGFYTNNLGAGGTYIFAVRIPTANFYEILGVPGTSYPGPTGNTSVLFLNTGGGTTASASLTVRGWELLDAD